MTWNRVRTGRGFVALAWLLAGCGGTSSEPRTGSLTLCGEKVSELSVDGLRYQVKGVKSCQGCQELLDPLKGYDCASAMVTATGLYRNSGSFGKVGVYEGTLELENLQIHEWKSKKNGF